MRQGSYGWVVVLCAFTLMFVGFGAAYSFAAFFRAFEAEFGASRAHISLVFSLCAFLYFLLGAPGGMLADRLRPLLGQTVIPENKPGAGGIVGNETVKAAPPDGSTLLLTPVATLAAFPHSHGAALRYDPFKDFEPVAHLANFQLCLLVNADIPAKNVAEYVALVKKDTRMGDYASAAAGSLPHYFGVLFAKSAGIDLTRIPYKGNGPAIGDLLGGHVSMMVLSLLPILGNVKAGTLRALAVTTATRSKLMPDVPTVAESAVPGFSAAIRYGLAAPAGTPKPIVDRLSRELRVALESEDVRARMLREGAEPVASTPEEYAADIDAEEKKWSALVKSLNLKIE